MYRFVATLLILGLLVRPAMGQDVLPQPIPYGQPYGSEPFPQQAPQTYGQEPPMLDSPAMPGTFPLSPSTPGLPSLPGDPMTLSPQPIEVPGDTLLYAPETLLGLEVEERLPGPFMWASGELLLWFLTDFNSPRVTTSSDPTSTASSGLSNGGALGLASTSILFNNDGFQHSVQPSGRFTLGFWLSRPAVFGFELVTTFVGEAGSYDYFTSNSNGTPLLGLPYFDYFTAQPAVYQVAVPGTSSGNITIGSTSQLWGAELHGLYNFRRNPYESLNALVGVRYLDLRDGMTIATSSTTLGGSVTFQGTTTALDGVITTTDAFTTRNQFVGGQLGLRSHRRVGNLTCDLTTKLALGSTRQELDTRGYSTLTTSLSTTTAIGGVYAQNSNIGHAAREVFSIIPEAECKIGYFLTPRWQIIVGYNVLFWSALNRPENQFDTTVDSRAIANSPNYDSSVNASPIRPTRSPIDTSLWLHGVSLGMKLTY